MEKPLDPKKIESARQYSSRAERREQRRKLMQDEIAENQRSNGVIVIPPKKLQEVQQERPNSVLRRIAASAQEEEQVGSFDMQVRHFTQRIEGNPDWELVEIYQDEGISATTVKKAPWFSKNDCRCSGREN